MPNTAYTRYFGQSKPLWFNQPGPIARRREILRHLEMHGATCFWKALAHVAPDCDALELLLAERLRQDDPFPAVDMASALQIVGLSDVHISVVGITAFNVMARARQGITTFVRHPNLPVDGRPGHGVALVFFDDEHNFAPHWCPCTSIRPRFTVPRTVEDREAEILAEINEGLPEPLPAMADWLFADEEEDEEPEMWLDAQVDGYNVIIPEAPQPPPPEPLPEWGRRGADIVPFHRFMNQANFGPAWSGLVVNRHPLDGITGVVGVNPPPVPTIARNLVNAVTFYRIQEDGVPLQATGGMLVREGHPSACDRGIHRMQGAGGVAWQLRPSVLADAHISTRHVVYCKLGDPSLMDNRLMDSGDYDPQTFEALHTATGTFRLTHPEYVERTVEAHGVAVVERFLFFHLNRVCASWTGALLRAVPYHLEKVTTVSTIGHGLSFRPLPETAFPTRKAWLRAQFSLLAQVSSDELKGLINDQRNQALEELERGNLGQNFDPYLLVAVLAERLVYSRQLMRTAGLASTRPFTCS